MRMEEISQMKCFHLPTCGNCFSKIRYMTIKVPLFFMSLVRLSYMYVCYIACLSSQVLKTWS